MKDGQQNLADLSSAPDSVLRVPGRQQLLPWFFSPGKTPQPVPSHQDTSLDTIHGLSSRSSPLLGPKSPARRCKVQKTPTAITLHADAKNPKQDYQNGCEMKMFLPSKLSSRPAWASPCAFFSADLFYLHEVGRRGADLRIITLSLSCKQLVINTNLVISQTHPNRPHRR